MPMSRFRRWFRRPRGQRGRDWPTRLELCPACGGDFVHPVTWTESGPADWWLLLRCGACDTWRNVVASNYAVAAYDRILDRGMDEIRITADRLEQESLSAQAETFRTALRMDLLSADDFR
jgi:hypothetical protein